MKLPLQPRVYDGNPNKCKILVYLTEAYPFVLNKRGILVHRPKKISIIQSAKGPSMVVEYYCGNSASGSDIFELKNDVETRQVVCRCCENKATKAGLPSTFAILNKSTFLGGNRLARKYK